MKEKERYLSLKSAAKEFSISVRTLYRLQNESRLNFHKFGGRTLVKASDLKNMVSMVAGGLGEHSPAQSITFHIQIPQQVYDELKVFIESTIANSLQQHIDKINAAPVFLTRDEAAKKLRISLPTLDRHLDENRIESKRAGKRILIPLQAIEAFIQNHRKTK